MTLERDTAYPLLNGDPSAQELREAFTPAPDELAFARNLTDQPFRRFTILLQLKLYRRLGRVVPLATIPERILRHVADASGYRRQFELSELTAYEQSRHRSNDLTALRAHLSLRRVQDKGKQILTGIARETARTRHYLSDIINAMLEELVRHSYELPPFAMLDKIAASAREFVHQAYYEQINEALSASAKATIDSLLKIAPGVTTSGWHALKREPRKPGNKEVRNYLAHVAKLRKLAEMLPPLDIPVAKLRYFRDLARSRDAAELADYHPVKRNALAVVFIRAQYNQTLDDAADLFIRLLQNLENVAQKNLMAYRAEHLKRTDMLVAQLKEILEAYQLQGSDDSRMQAIANALDRDPVSILVDCNEHLAYAGEHFIPFLDRPYSAQRALLFNCLEIMNVQSTSSDPLMAKLLMNLEYFRNSRREVLSLNDLDLTHEEAATWLSAAWRREVFVKSTKSMVKRRFFELAVLFQIKAELKSGDLFVPGANKFDDYRETLVSDEKFEEELPIYEEITGIPTNPLVFTEDLRRAMHARCAEVDQRFPSNGDASIVDGRLILRKAQRPEVSKDIVWLDGKLLEHIEAVSIVDVLHDVATWTGMERHFKPLAATEPAIENLLYRVVTSVFCYGCNLGPVQTARSIRNLTYKKAAWLNSKYVNDDVLQRATTDVINVYNAYELPSYWGSGKSASADGTKWSMYEQNIISEYHLRYGGYGGIGYYHVSDKYIALLSRFIACGSYEAIYILDVLRNESDIQPTTIHGDTQSQSFPVFALAYLLGIDLMPRIRNLRDLSLSRPSRDIFYPNLQALYGDGVIDWELIETHLHDMLRVAISIKTGKITASTILRRLGTASRKNKLYFAFRELGRVVRTMFLLRYVDSTEVRQTITAATNKSEEFNNFTQWAFFGGQGIIAENLRHEQEKIVGYNHLVANMVILHNVETMSRVIDQLQAEGHTITAEALAGLSPYRTAHINRFGDYTVDLARPITPNNTGRRLIAGSPAAPGSDTGPA